MNVEMDDAVVFVYTLGVMVSGYFIGTGGDASIQPFNGLIGVVVAVLWTAYFARRVTPRVFEWEHGELGEEDDEEDTAGEDASEGPEEDPAPDEPAPWDQ